MLHHHLYGQGSNLWFMPSDIGDIHIDGLHIVHKNVFKKLYVKSTKMC